MINWCNSTSIDPNAELDRACSREHLRFQGLLFDDNGTLRMDCGQVNDGVAQ